jgi:hypothetical protein
MDRAHPRRTFVQRLRRRAPALRFGRSLIYTTVGRIGTTPCRGTRTRRDSSLWSLQTARTPPPTHLAGTPSPFRRQRSLGGLERRVTESSQADVLAAIACVGDCFAAQLTLSRSMCGPSTLGRKCAAPLGSAVDFHVRQSVCTDVDMRTGVSRAQPLQPHAACAAAARGSSSPFFRIM